MKTYTINGNEVTVSYATATTAGYGHKKITVDLEDSTCRTGTFSAITNNMPDYDDATDLEGQEKYEALYELIDTKIEDEVFEWL